MSGIILREVYFIRHGESYTNLDDFVPDNLTDANDPLLTETGMAQAEALGAFYKRISFDDVYSSGLRRAAMTGAALAKHQQQKTLNILPDLCEVFLEPEYEGQSLDALQSLCPDVKLKTAEGYEGSEKLIIPDYNPRVDEPVYFERAAKVLDYIEKRYNSGEKIAVVSHAGFLTYIMFYLMGVRDKEPEEYDIRLSNTGVSKITWFEPGTHRYGDYVFDSINDKSHLNHIG